MAYYTQTDLEKMGFAHLGQGVKISDKAAIYDHARIALGDYARIDDFCVISGKITLGRNVHLAAQCLLAGGSEGIIMDDFSGAAYGVKIFSQSDDYTGQTMTNPTVPTAYKNEYKAAVHIGRHCIIGAGAIVGPGVNLGDGAALGAGAVAMKSLPGWAVYAGVPAKKIKDRAQDLLALEAEFLKKGFTE